MLPAVKVGANGNVVLNLVEQVAHIDHHTVSDDVDAVLANDSAAKVAKVAVPIGTS